MTRKKWLVCLLPALALTVPAYVAFAGGSGPGAGAGAIPVFFHVIRRGTTPIERPSAAYTRNVLRPGDYVQVDVAAQFPTDAFALAAAEVEVSADSPGWFRVSDGVVSGSTVKEISFEQAHNPNQGVVADSTNPVRLWSGSYAPAGEKSQLVRIEAAANAFSFFPSELTGSSVGDVAAPGTDMVLYDPVFLGGVYVAASDSTEIAGGAGLDVLIANTGGDRILIGMLLPAVQQVRVEPHTRPTDFVVEVEAEDRAGPTSSVRLTFSEAINPGTYDFQPEWPLADDYELRFFRAGVDYYLKLQGVDGDIGPTTTVDRLPDGFSSRIRSDRKANQTRMITRFAYDEPVKVVAPDGTVIVAEGFEVHAIQHNLKQLSLGVHSVEMHGTGGVNFQFSDGSVRYLPK